MPWTAQDDDAAAGEGWSLFNISTPDDPRPDIQRIDELEVFRSDDAAVAYVQRQAQRDPSNHSLYARALTAHRTGSFDV